MRVRLAGPTDLPTAFSRVNAHWADGLRSIGHTVLGDSEPGGADVTLVHDYRVPFGPPAANDRPQVAVRTWDFGPFPPAWAQTVVDHYDELWVHSSWNCELAVRGGVPEDRVRVVPVGVDPEVLVPDGPSHPLTDAAATSFLWVGASVRRKGFDLLLDAYLEAFTPADDVQLVVKDHTGDVFYQGQDHGDRARELAGDAAAPAVRYVDEQLPAAELAALYRGADALVLPYRAEGFAMTALEAMACGTAPVVPRFGSALDYTDDDTAWYVAAHRIAVPVDRSMPYNSLGLTVRITAVDFCEPDRGGLVERLRLIAAEDPTSRQRRGAAAARRAQHWSWAASTAHVAAGLETVRSSRS